jgi:hypothetical protein
VVVLARGKPGRDQMGVVADGDGIGYGLDWAKQVSLRRAQAS